MSAAFVVERYNWRAAGGRWVRFPGETPVAAFDTAAAAEADRARREAAARAAVGNPFRCAATLPELTDLPDGVFRDWLLDAGVDAPDPDPDGTWPWAAWADLHHPTWTAAEAARVWDGLTRVRFFRAAAGPAGPPLFAVVEVPWGNGEYAAAAEGGNPVAVWGDPDRAGADRARRDQDARAQMASWVAMNSDRHERFDRTARRRAAADPFDVPPDPESTDVTGATYCEVVAVACGDPEPPRGPTAYAVVRAGWAVDDDGWVDRRHGDGGVPVAVFGDPAAAEADRARREAEAWAAVNPFHLAQPRAPSALASLDAYGSPRRVVDALRRAGLEPPAGAALDGVAAGDPAWAAWWARAAAALPEDVREAVRASFPDPYYAVVPVWAGDTAAVPRAAERTLFVVRRTTWVPHGGPGRNPLSLPGAYADRAAAEARAAAHEDGVKRGVVPFPAHADGGHRTWADYSSLPPAEGCRRLAEAGVLAHGWPDRFVPTWHWWEDACPRLRPAQRKSFWDVMDRVRLFEVVEVRVEGDG